MKILHVGLGVRGMHWVDIVGSSGDFESVALVDPDPKACSGIATGSHLPHFDNLIEALGASDANAAIIAAPIRHHAGLAAQCLDAGLAVLIEKPLAGSLGDAAKVARAAKNSGRCAVAGQNQRFCKTERSLREMVREGLVGEVDNVRCAARRARPGTGTDLHEIEYPQLLEDAVHHFDSLRCILGSDAGRVVANAYNPPGSDYPQGAATHALIEMANGVHVQYAGSLAANDDSYTWWIEGDGGVLWSDRKRILWRKRGRRLFRPMRMTSIPPADAAAYPFEGTASLMRGLASGSAETNVADNIRTIAMIEACILSDREQREIEVGSLLAGHAIE